MADESKPAVTSAEPAAPVADAAPAAVAEPKADEPAAAAATEAAAEAKAEEPAAAAEASAAAEEAAPAEAEAVKEAEPIYSGTLQYSNHPIKALLQLKPKLHFYFGSESIKAEADKLKHTVKASEPHTAHTAAWSHETGLGLLYFVKDAEQKDSPQGALNLSEIEDLAAAETKKITFRLYGSKHTLTADTQAARDGWFKAFEENIAKAKELKETIVSSSGFKETYEKLTKPALAAPAESTPKKSTDSRSERAARSETQGKNRPAKDRSQSRGKKFFDQLRGKKEVAKEETVAAEEAPKVEEPAAAEPAAEATEAAGPVAEEPATAASEEAKADEPKKTRRSSKFFDYVKTLSPTREKKQEEVAAPEADAEAAPAAEAAATDAAAEAEAATNANADAAAAEAPAGEATEAAATEPAAPGEKTERRRSSFLINLAGSVRNTLQKTDKKAEGAKEEAKPEEAAAEKPAEAAAETPADAPADAPAEKKEHKYADRVGQLRRNLSKALRVGGKDGKKSKTPGTEKVEESATEAKAEEEPKAEETAAAAEPATEEPKTEAVAAPTGPTVIGDVVGEAVTVGTAPPSNPAVSATA